LYLLLGNPGRNELRPESGGFNCGLPLGECENDSVVDFDNDPSVRPPRVQSRVKGPDVLCGMGKGEKRRGEKMGFACCAKSVFVTCA